MGFVSAGTRASFTTWLGKGAQAYFRKDTPMAKEEFTDAIMLLKHDHRTVEDLFSKFQKARDKNK